MARIISIVFDRNEHPLRATIRTRLGTVKVRWMDIAGDRCWQTSGILDAKKLAAPVIARIERMVEHADAHRTQSGMLSGGRMGEGG